MSRKTVGYISTVRGVSEAMDRRGWFRGPVRLEVCDMDGEQLDLRSALAVCDVYGRIFERFPQLVGRFAAPGACPIGMRPGTYAWCWYDTGLVELNPAMWTDYNRVQAAYSVDVETCYHPAGTDARAIVAHEVGHAVDGLLTGLGIAGGYGWDWSEHRASEDIMRDALRATGAALGDVGGMLSTYAETSQEEWFGEAFAEYVCSPSPRPMAMAAGEAVERLIRRLSIRIR